MHRSLLVALITVVAIGILGGVAVATPVAAPEADPKASVIEAERLLARAERFALTVGHGQDYRRDEVLTAIAEVQLSMGNRTEALATVDELVAGLPPGQPGQRQSSDRYEADDYRTLAYLRLVSHQAAAGSYEGAAATAELINDDFAYDTDNTLYRARAYIIIALARIDAGDIEGACGSLATAEGLANDVGYYDETLARRAATLAAVARTYMIAGRRQEALATCAIMRLELPSIPAGPDKVWMAFTMWSLADPQSPLEEICVPDSDPAPITARDVYELLADVHLEVGNVAGAMRISVHADPQRDNRDYVAAARAVEGKGDAARKLIASLPDADGRTQARRRIVEALLLSADISTAAAFADEIEDAAWQALSHAEVSAAQATADDVDGAWATLDKAMAALPAVDDADVLTKLQIAVVSAQIALGEPDKAAAVARQIEDPATRGWQLIDVVRAQLAEGHLLTAEGIAWEIEDRDGTRDSAWQRMEALLAVVEAHIAAEDLAAARRVLDDMINDDRASDGRLTLNTEDAGLAMVKAYLLAGDLDSAKELAELLDNDDAFACVARHLTSAGDLAEAVVWARRISWGAYEAEMLAPIAEALIRAGDLDNAAYIISDIATEYVGPRVIRLWAAAMVRAGRVAELMQGIDGGVEKMWVTQDIMADYDADDPMWYHSGSTAYALIGAAEGLLERQ